MIRLESYVLVTILVAVVVAPASVFAQGGQQSSTAKPDSAATPSASRQEGTRTASALYEEASTYGPKKFEEFAKKKVPFDPQLLEKTLQEQRELAARNAKELAARGDKLEGTDFYFLGMLYHLSENANEAIEPLKRFLASNPSPPQRAQATRYIVAQITAKKDRLEESEKAIVEYLKHEPQKASERVTMENTLAASYLRNKKLDGALIHAEEAFKAAKQVQPTQANPTAADYSLYMAGTMLVDVHLEMKQLEKAVAVLEEMRKLALVVPSPRLYMDATSRLATVLIDGGRKKDATQMLEDSIAYVKANIKNQKDQTGLLSSLARKQKQLTLRGEVAPEIEIIEWIDQKPVKLSEMRGRVVLLDFWATWCGPCIAAFPHLKKWQQKYEDKGLIILGLTKYYGSAKGRDVTPEEELKFLREFKKEHNLNYGFAVSDNDDNLRSYGVTGIPTTVLIDRRGVIRLVETGSGAGNEAEINATLEKLIQEQ
jgi:thiol-disulfide isomerase/thioredoxin